MVVGRNSDNQIVEIYDSFEKTWKTVGHLSRKVNALYTSVTTFKHAAFIVSQKRQPTKIMGLNLGDGTCTSQVPK